MNQPIWSLVNQSHTSIEPLPPAEVVIINAGYKSKVVDSKYWVLMTWAEVKCVVTRNDQHWEKADTHKNKLQKRQMLIWQVSRDGSEHAREDDKTRQECMRKSGKSIGRVKGLNLEGKRHAPQVEEKGQKHQKAKAFPLHFKLLYEICIK